jgi:hypothetical protein
MPLLFEAWILLTLAATKELEMPRLYGGAVRQFYRFAGEQKTASSNVFVVTPPALG